MVGPKTGSLSREEQLKLRRYERAVARMDKADREIFLGHVVEDLSYHELADRHGIGTAEVEQSLRSCLAILSDTLDEKDPCWWRFWPW